MKLVLASLLLLGVAWAKLNCECGRRNTGRIAGGKVARKNEYPWMIALQLRKNKGTICGGAIITQKHVVTAAHCTWRSKPEDLAIVVGAHDLTNLTDSTKKYYLVKLIIRHPSYDNKTDLSDIAILVINTQIEYNQFIGPVCMPSELLGDEMTGQFVKAMGWGDIGPKANRDQLKNLKEVDLKLISHKLCKNSNAALLCTFTEGKDTCKGFALARRTSFYISYGINNKYHVLSAGDSGGPLVWLDPETNRFTLVGVVSYGFDECGKTTEPGINTNVSYYLRWINDMILCK